jgi:hypothetical protein
MSLARAYLASTALTMSLLATSAAADLTSAEVWGDWRGYLEGMGYTVTATENTSGDTLSVNDISIQMNGGPDIEEMVISMGSLQFVAADNGSVEVVMPASLPIIIEVTPKSTERAARMELSYTQTGHSMIASGDPSDMVYDYSAETFGLALAALTVDGTEFDETTARFSLTGDAMQSQTKVTAGQTRNYTQSIQWGSVVYDLFFKSPDGVEAMTLNSMANDLAFSGTSTVPVDNISQAQDLGPLLAAGFAFDGSFTTQGTETKVEIVSEEGTSKIKTGSASTTLAVAMGQDGIRYDVDATKVQVGAQLAGLPFPLFAEMENSGFEMTAPLMKSDDAQDFALAFNMTDFTMSDIVWALFDPSNQLPRDPATIALGLSGKAKVLVDALAPEAVQDLVASGQSAGEIEALKIDTLTINAVGASVDATGDLTFDNTDKTTLPGFPKPVGDININLSGANGLLDKLVAMGMLPSDQVMGARMMMGLFAVPGDAPDTLKSKIEFNEAGQILANGQRLK